MKLIPKADRVLVKKIDIEEKSKGGIILHNLDGNKELFYGIVVATGEGKYIDSTGKTVPTYTKVGEVVQFKPQNALEVTFQGDMFYLLRDNEIAFGVEGVSEEVLKQYTND